MSGNRAEGSGRPHPGEWPGFQDGSPAELGGVETPLAEGVDLGPLVRRLVGALVENFRTVVRSPSFDQTSRATDRAPQGNFVRGNDYRPPSERGPASSEGEGRRPRRNSTRFFGEGGEAVTIWVFTTDGFYSVTAYDEALGGTRADSDELVVARTRVRDDLTRLSGWIHDAEIVATPKADYPYRVVCRREDWARYLEAATKQIDYTNFKECVAERLGKSRHDVLLSVWTTLRRLETEVT